MNVAVSHPQFMDVITQVVGFRTPQLMSAFREPFDANHALVLSLDMQAVQPRQQRRGTIRSSEDHNLRSRQPASPRHLTSHFCDCRVNSILRYRLNHAADEAFRNIALGENYFRLLGLDYTAPSICPAADGAQQRAR